MRKRRGASQTPARRVVLKALGRAGLAATIGTGVTRAEGKMEQTSTDSGSLIWKFETGGWVTSSPTIVEGTVFFGSRDDEKVYAVSTDDGTEEWQFDAGDFVYSSPNVVNDTVFIGCGGGTAEEFNNLYALDANDGTEHWRFESDGYVRSSPTVVDGSTYFGTTGGTIYSVDTQTGNKNWEVTDEFNRDVNTSPTVVDGTVFIGGHDSVMYGLDADDGSVIWSFETTGRVSSSPTVENKTVIFGDGDGFVYAVDADDGTKQWETSITGASSSPTVAESTVYVGGDKLYAFDLTTSDKQWEFDTESETYAPTVADDTVFVSTSDGAVYAVDADDGSEYWQYSTNEILNSSPTVVDGRIYIGIREIAAGSLHAIDAGVTGSSEDSRVNLGTLGHHSDRASADQPISGEENRDTFLIEPVNPTIKAGSTTEIDVEVTNNLNKPVTNIEGKLFADDPLSSANDETFTESLDPGETTTVTVSISISGSAAVKNYPVSMDFRYVDSNGNSKLTDTYRTVITVEPSSGQPPSSGIIESNQTRIVIGGAGTIGVSLYAWQRSRGSDDDTTPTESSTVETDTASQATANSTTEDGTATTNELQEQAIESIDRAERAAEHSDYEMAVESYQAALTQLEEAAAEASDPDTEKEVEATLAETEAALDGVTTHQEHRDSIATTLQAAERSFKEGIARYTADEQTVARIRFRQARDAFGEAQQAIDDSDAEVLAQPIEVSFEQEPTLPSMDLEDLAVLDESTVDTLAAIDIESITHLDVETDEITPAVVSDLKESDEISSEETALLTILSWWYEGASREFTSETVISRRYEQAGSGFNQST